MTQQSDSASGVEPKVGLWSRYRRWYHTLPHGLQMIGLQLWLPFVFVIAFCFCYVFAFHSPNPHDVNVALVGPDTTQTQQLAHTIETSSGGTLDVSVVPNADAARDAVRAGDLAGAFVPAGAGGQPSLIVASAQSEQLKMLAQQVFSPMAAAQGATLQTEDVAPLPSHDSFGISLFYMALVWTIAGYMVAMFVGMMGVQLSHKVRFATIAVCGFVLSMLSTVLVRFAVGAVDGHFWELFAIGWATTVAVGLVVNGLAYFMGRFVTGAALLIFVFAAIPASGGAYPASFMPEPFHSLHNVVLPAGVVDLLKHTVYGVGPSYWTGALYLIGYAVVGVLLALVGKRFYTWRMKRRMEKQKPPSMMMQVQFAGLAAAQAASKSSETVAEPGPDGGQNRAADADQEDRDAESEADVDAAAAAGAGASA